MTFIEHARAIYGRFVAWWWPIPDAPAENIFLRDVVTEPPILIRTRRLAEEDEPPGEPVTTRDYAKHELGEFYFRETILDQLDYYMTCIARMRRVDVEAWAMYSRVGANVFPNTTLLPSPESHVLSPWFREALPAFGAVFFGGHVRDLEKIREGKDAKLHPRFMYFTKYDRNFAPPNVERVPDGTVYACTVFWDDDKDPFFKDGYPTSFPVVVESSGRVRLLKVLDEETIKIRHKRRDPNLIAIGPEYSWVHRKVWRDAHWFFKDWAAEHRDVHRPNVASFLEQFFILTMNMFERSNASMIRVAASKGELTAVFGVNIKRTPYFFKDREVEIGASGRKKRIFHIVRPHMREGVTAVRMHFRGERKFEWNGYSVLISVPGLHHSSVLDLDGGFHDSDWKEGRGLKGLGWLSRRIRAHVQHNVKVTRHGTGWRRSA